MTTNVVSIHPYFKAHPGKLPVCLALMREFVEKTKSEERVLYYEFTVNGEEFFCREGYIGAEGVLAHISNVGAQLQAMAKLADMYRIEFHGPAAEIEKLKGPLADLKPAWFVFECGVNK